MNQHENCIIAWDQPGSYDVWCDGDDGVPHRWPPPRASLEVPLTMSERAELARMLLDGVPESMR